MTVTVESQPGSATRQDRILPDRLPSTPVRWMWPVAGVVAFLAFWQVVAVSVDSLAVLPGPWEVARNFAVNFDGSPTLKYLGLDITSYAGNLRYTGSIVLGGWLVGGTLGILAGLASARLQWVRNLVDPVTTVFGAVPVLVVAPFVLVWFGTSSLGKFCLISFFSAVTICVVAQSAALTLPMHYEEYAATLGASPSRRMWHVTFPATLTANLTGLRAALGQAWSLEAVAELLGAPAGIGRAIAVRAGTGDIASVLALIIALGILALICDGILSLVVRRLARWQTEKEPQ
ncbi:ABC transporter permease [Streptomyces tendae]|uniref:ABC transporter permease n=1 Tax=Streptomyces tendae TaxID=1932 RepID=UPI003684235D